MGVRVIDNNNAATQNVKGGNTPLAFPRLLTLEEVAKLLGCQRRYVREHLCKEGGLPYIVFKRKTYRISQVALAEWIARRERGLAK